MILSIESSCDDSSIAITHIENNQLIFHKKISQEKEHACYGGVVPELASRLHAIDLPNILEACKPYLPQLKAVAVTNQPGLGVTLLEGIAMAKTIAMVQNIPLLAVHHLKGHIYSLFIGKEANSSSFGASDFRWAYTSYSRRKFRKDDHFSNQY